MQYIICICLALNLACQSRRPVPIGPDTNEKISLIYQKMEAAEFEAAWNQIKELKPLSLTLDQQQNLKLAEARCLYLVGELNAANQQFQELNENRELLNSDNQKVLRFYLLDLYDSQGNLNAYLATLQELDSLELNLTDSFLKEAKKSFAFLQSQQLKNQQEALVKAQSYEPQLLNLPLTESQRLYFEATYFNYSHWTETHYDMYVQILNLMLPWRTHILKNRDPGSHWSALAFQRSLNEWKLALKWAQQPTIPAHLNEHTKNKKTKDLKLARLTQLLESLIRFENLLPPDMTTNQILSPTELTAFLALKTQIQNAVNQTQEAFTPTRKGTIKDLGLIPLPPADPSFKDSP